MSDIVRRQRDDKIRKWGMRARMSQADMRKKKAEAAAVERRTRNIDGSVRRMKLICGEFPIGPKRALAAPLGLACDYQAWQTPLPENRSPIVQ